MRYWKRVNPQGIATTVESYSHDAEVNGATEITGVEFEAFLSALAAAPPTPEEIAEQVKAQKRVDAQNRAIAAIQANATGAPWGRILMDLAVAQGWIEEE